MSQPLVSVALPVYNGADYIESAIASLLSQTEACEIVLSDDCSTDDTVEIVRSIRSPQIKLLENRLNGGQFVNFNRALRATSGNFIQLFSHDDVAQPDFLRSQKAALGQQPDIGLVYASCNIIDVNGRFLEACDDEGTPSVIDFKTYLHISSRFGSLPPSVSCIMVRREVLDAVGPFDERFAVAGDLEFCNRVAERFMLARNRSMLINVRVHGGSVTLSSSSQLKYLREEIDILPFYRRHLGERGYSEMIRRRARQRGVDHAKYILRSFLRGRISESTTAWRALSRVHNVPMCIAQALLQKAKIVTK